MRRAATFLLCLAALALVLYPIVWLVSASLTPVEDLVANLRSLFPGRVTTDGYAGALEGAGGESFWTFLGNSTIVASGAVVGNVVSCSLAAYAFARLRFRLSGPLFAFALVTIMLPAHVTLIPQYVVFQRLEMIDTFVPLILPKLLATDAFFVFLMVQFMRGIPRELDEAAKIDGCGPIRNYRYVVLPLSRPALVTTAIFTFIWTWNDFFSQLIYLSSTENYTIPMGLRLFIDQTSSSSYGPMFAMSVLSLVPIGLFFLAFQRFLVAGVATTGLKG
ncbi:multiple sugar transport system permease protein [Lentzea waywayandensis]|uniref:Multiple sugar transport system permease protein n=1 Tax=Lentzea waywayandensis TaxID=84724 RepID=A0A1I6ER42_9PSEU|nr:carbohydrate ABC transporter permease [Lentzea waywayandensis]SFR20266.1 multiple sugar transport system permease protein [Lentzea waywayandensis]